MPWCLSSLSIARLCVLANEPPLYILKLSSSPQNPTVFNCKSKDLFERKPNQIPPKYSSPTRPPGCWFWKKEHLSFCRLRKFQSDPRLLLNGSPIPVVEEVKFLRIIFDKKLSLLPHLRYLKNKCSKALNLLRVVAHTSWGADQQTITSV